MKNIVLQEKRELKKILSALYHPCKIKYYAKNIPVFRITFEHKYMDSFPARIKNWIRYGTYKIRRFFKPNSTHEMMRPLHLKYSCMPIDELRLKRILNKNGYMIIKEDLGNTYTAYDITKY